MLVSTFTLADGTTWRFRADYCGSIDGDMWSGAGTFSFTTPESDTLHGTFTTSAAITSDGEPYELTIESGTGRYTGASGSCSLDNHLVKIALGDQEQTGTFSCEISIPR